MAAPTYNFEVSENQGGTILYLDDNTGAYEVTENPGGYGSPNTARADLALIVIAKYKASDGSVTITADTYDPEGVTQWVYDNDLQGDGHYEFNVYPVAKKAAQPATLNTFVYNFTTNQLERGNGSSFVSATYPELEIYDHVHETVNHAHVPDLFSAFNYVNELIIEGADQRSRSDLKQFLFETSVMIHGSLSYFTEENYTLFQENIEKYQSRVTEILALE
jgi:hypothetical protein